MKITPPMVSRLGEILSHHRGNTEVRIKLQGARKTTVLRLDRHRVKPDPALFGDLKVLLGPVLPGRLSDAGRTNRTATSRGAPETGRAPRACATAPQT